jgi:hypothetical protein
MTAVAAAEETQRNVDQSLERIQENQKELEVTLNSYEKVTNEILEGSGPGSIRVLDVAPADNERDNK